MKSFSFYVHVFSMCLFAFCIDSFNILHGYTNEMFPFEFLSNINFEHRWHAIKTIAGVIPGLLKSGDYIHG